MASYKIVPLRDDGIDTKTLQNRVENLSALESSADLRKGTLPYTFQAFGDGLCYVEYGREDYVERPVLEEGDEETKVADMYPIVFLGNGYVAYDANCVNEVEQEIVTTIADLLQEDLHYEPVTFDEDTLHDVIDRSDRVRRADVAPKTGGKPEKVRGVHKAGLQRTDWWEQYVSDPLESVQVELPDENIHRNIGFFEDGKVTVYGQNIPQTTQTHVLQYITDEVIANIDVNSFQQTLRGVNR